MTKYLVLLVVGLFLVPSSALAQCNGVFPPGTFCGNTTASAAPPKPVALTSQPSTANITRAQIATTGKLASTFVVNGFRTANDLGTGATYSSVGASCPSGLMAITSADGVCFNMVLTETINAGWFGAFGDDGATKITAPDIAANPQWRGTYTAGDSWDTVAVQESKYAAYASASTPGNIVWNEDSGNLNSIWFLPAGQFGINKQIYTVQVGFEDRGAGRLQAALDWIGADNTIMWLCDGCAYGAIYNLTVTTSITQSYSQATSGYPYNRRYPLFSLDWTSAHAGLKTQQVTLYDMVCLTGINGQCMGISNSGNGAQGDTITFVNPFFGGNSSDYALRLGGANTLAIVIVNGDCQGFFHDCIQNFGGSVAMYGTHFENQNTNFSSFTPITSQLTSAGADYNQYSAVSAESNTIHNARAEDTILLGNYGRSGFADVISSLTIGVDVAFDHFLNYPYLQGWAITPTVNNAKKRSFMIVDTGGIPAWKHVTSSSGVVLTDATASYTVNEWAGFNVHWRFGSNGFTFHCPVVSNTATTLTLSAGCNGGTLPTPSATTMYLIGGLSAGSEPNWDSVANGHRSIHTGSSQGFYTIAGSNEIGVSSYDYPLVSVGDYLVIAYGDTLAPGAGSATMPMPYYGKVTGKSASPCAAIPAIGQCLTMDRNVGQTIGDTVNGNDAFVYYGPPVTDNNLSWIDLEFSNVDGTDSIRTFHGPGRIAYPITAMSAYKPLRPDWFNPDSQVSNLADDHQPVFAFDNQARLSGFCEPLVDAATIDLTIPLRACNNIPYTPLQDVTLDAPAGQANIAQDFALFITTSGTTSRTVTFNTNFESNGPLETGVVSGVRYTILFRSNGTLWKEIARSSSLDHVPVSAGKAPVLTSCGGGSPSILGNDEAGEVTMGTTATGCVITFNTPYTSAPYCVLNWQATPLASQSWSVSNTAITTTQTSTSGNVLNYICRARVGG